MIQYKCFTVNFVQVNSYLLWDDTKEACLIDPGFSMPAEQQQFIQFMSQEGLTLKRCIATHMHFDHILGSRFIEEKYGVQLEVPHLEFSEVPDIATQLSAFGVPASEGFDFTPKPLDASKEPTIRFGDTTLQILETPGHSPGHYTYYYAVSGEEMIFCGDVLFKNGMGRYDLWGGAYNILMRSIREVLFTLPDNTKVLPGHGPETTIGQEKHNFM